MLSNKSILFNALLILMIVNSCTGKKDVQEKVRKYPNGATSRKQLEINGTIEGLMTDYFINGQIKQERLFENGLQNGKSINYFESGGIEEIQYYNKGLRIMGDTVFYPSGKIHFTSWFENNKKNGPFKRYSETGELEFEAIYEMDSIKSVKNYLAEKDNKLQ
ncbi:MAG: hypothetical protein M3Q56_08610 [Bacteroidota bacterium]|nr:hypothetical protein [Bacteroidota bacterium]